MEDDQQPKDLGSTEDGDSGVESVSEPSSSGWAAPDVGSRYDNEFDPTKSKKSDSADQLAAQENGATDDKKDDLVKDSSELSKLGKLAPGGLGVIAKSWAFAKSNKGLAGGGGAGIAVMFGVMIFFSGTYMAVMSRQGFVNKFSLGAMFVSKRAHATALIYGSREAVNNVGKITKGIADPEIFKGALKSSGFELFEGEGTNNALKAIHSETGRILDFGAEDFSKQTQALLSGSEGKLVARNIVKEFSEKGAFYKNPSYRGLLGRLKKSFAGDRILNSKKATDPKNTPEKTQAAYRQAAESPEVGNEVSAKPNAANEKTAKEESAKNGNDPKTGTTEPSDPSKGAFDDLSDAAISQTDDLAENIVEGTADSVAVAAADASSDVGDLLGKTGAALAKNGGEAAAKSTAKAVAVSSLGILNGGIAYAGMLCKLKGMITVLSVLRHAMVIKAASRFALSWLTVAEHEKAGLFAKNIPLFFASVGGLGIFSSITMQVTSGRTGIHLPSAEKSLYTAGQVAKGFWANMNNIIERVNAVAPILLTSCRLTTNTLFQVGTAVAGGVIAFFSGGASLAAMAAALAEIGPLTVATFVAQFAVDIGSSMLPSMLKRYATNQITSVMKNKKNLSTFLGVGLHTVLAGGSRANIMLPATRAQSEVVNRAASADYKNERSSENFFARFLSPTNGTSLTSELGMSFGFAMASGPTGLFSKLPLGIGSFMPFGGSLSSQVYAANNANDYRDKKLEEKGYDVAFTETGTEDITMLPEIPIDNSVDALIKNGYIDETTGMPKSSKMKKMVNACFGGDSSSSIYKDPTGNDLEKLTNGASIYIDDDACIDHSKHFANEKFNATEAYAYLTDGVKPGFVDKLFGTQKAYAADLNRPVSIVEHVANYCSYITHTQALNEQIKGIVPPQAGTDPCSTEKPKQRALRQGTGSTTGTVTGVPTPGLEALDCSGHTEINSPTSSQKLNYSAEVATGCAKLKADCMAGNITPTGNILCKAMTHSDSFYGNGYGSETGDRAIPRYGFSAAGNFGEPYAEKWVAAKLPGLNVNNLLECSGLIEVAFYEAFPDIYKSKVAPGGVGCSHQWRESARPDLFTAVTQSDVQHGDMLVAGNGCGKEGKGHIAMAASKVDSNGNLLVYETSNWGTGPHFRSTNISEWNAGLSRFKVSGQ